MRHFNVWKITDILMCKMDDENELMTGDELKRIIDDFETDAQGNLLKPHAYEEWADRASDKTVQMHL